MSDFFEIVVKNFSGLSSETKPTIAAGNQVPNGSRWREVDTGKMFYFNLSNDTWYEVGLSLSATDVVNYDASGNPISSQEQTNGDYHLGVSMAQDVYADLNNTNSTNLASGATWAGDPTSTLGVVGLQWSLNTDQNCLVYIEQSSGSHTGLGTVATNGTTTLTGTSTIFTRSFVVGDTISVAGETDRIIATIVSNTELTVTVAFSTTASGTAYTHYHWDISYSFDFIAVVGNKGEGETVQATLSYWRIRVVNSGSATTTYFRVSGVLCPVATPLPSSLSDDRRLKTETTISGRENTGRHVWVNPTNELAVSPVYRMVGTAFDGLVLDPNFWTPTLVNGSVAQAGGILTLQTSAAINSSAKYVSKRKARFVPGSAQLMVAGMAMTAAPVAGNTRRIGAYDTNNGYFMQVSGTTFSVGTRKAASDTLVSSGSFNGNLGLSWSPSLSTFYKVEIEFTPLAVIYYINGKRLHSIQSSGLSDTLTLPITIENINTTNATDIDLQCVGAYIARQGELVTNPTYYYHALGTTAGVNLKYGAGVLHRITINNVVNNSVITISDGTAGVTDPIFVHTAGDSRATVSPIEIGAPFSNGLRLTVATQNASITLIYE
jgi:hypothetical protein